jgi:histidyl-tRNA synthetase
MIKAVTGTKDILPPDIPRWKYLEKIVERVFSSFNYKEIRTPVFEETAFLQEVLVKKLISSVKRCTLLKIEVIQALHLNLK